ncbi:MAG: hypothetical protein JSW15_09245, partial [Deltaproteobacteria bacterium]
MLLKRRKEVHEKIGSAIEQIYAERLEEFYEMIAYHYSKGGNSKKAFEYLKLSGNKATKNYSLWEAFHFYREAMNILNQLPAIEQNREEQIEVRLLLSVPMHLLDYPEDSLQILQEGERLSKEIGDERSVLAFQSKLGSYYAHHGEPLLATKYTKNAFRKAEKAQDIELIAPVACELCNSYLYASEFSRSIEVALKVLALLEKTKRERDFFGTRYNVYSGLCAHCVLAFGWLGNFEQGKILFKKGLQFALEIQSLFGLGLIELFYGVSLNFMGDGKNAVDHFEKSMRYAEEAQVDFLSGVAHGGLGYGYYLLGEMDTAQMNIEKGLKIYHKEGFPTYLSMFLLNLSMVYFDSGDLKNTQKCAEEALRSSQKNNEKHWE